MISLSEPVLGEPEKEVLCSVIDSGWLTMGDRVAAFERAFAELNSVEEAIAVNSCTAGLHLCLAALGIGPGEEVLVPSLTFVATANVVLYTGAVPVFVDIDQADLPHLSMDDARKKLSPRSRAVIVMHYGGYLVDLPGWRSFCDLYGLDLIEDAAHAPAVGRVGQLSHAAAFSFFPNKNMTTGEGGMVLARDRDVRDRIRKMRAHGMTTGTVDRHKGHAFSYDVTTLGYNYRLDELRGALGLVQLARLPEWNEKRRELTAYYRSLLAEKLPEVCIPFDEGHETAAHLMPVLLPDGSRRQGVMSHLREKGLQTSIHYPPVHRFSYYRERYPGVELPHTDKFFSRELTLPLHPGLTEKDVERVVNVLKEGLLERGS